MNQQINLILKTHQLKLIKQISYNAWLCTTSKENVVVKTGKNVTHERNIRTKYILNFLESQKLNNISVPKFVAHSDKNEKHQYIITTYQEATELPWSEFDNGPHWAGSDISSKYIPHVLDALSGLENINTANINFTVNSNPFNFVIETIDEMQKNKLITSKTVSKIKKLIQSNANDYFNKNIILSNGDFYPRNLLITTEKKPYIIDWDGAHLTTFEQTAMYFWCSMTGNPKFQKKLLSHYKARLDWNRERYILGAVLAVTEDVSTWMNEPKCSKITQAYSNLLDSILLEN